MKNETQNLELINEPETNDAVYAFAYQVCPSCDNINENPGCGW